MKRFITIENYDGTIEALTENDNYKELLEHPDCAGWVWQFAENAEQAKNQHYIKHDQWDADMQSGREPKDTY